MQTSSRTIRRAVIFGALLQLAWGGLFWLAGESLNPHTASAPLALLGLVVIVAASPGLWFVVSQENPWPEWLSFIAVVAANLVFWLAAGYGWGLWASRRARADAARNTRSAA